jgi:hypothetical protein
MSKALNKRISKAYDKIYSKGDNGLDYMDRHVELDADLMEFFYNDTLDQLSKEQLTTLADQLETVVADMQFDLA